MSARRVTADFNEEVAKVAEFWLRADAAEAMEDAAKEEQSGHREAALNNMTAAEQLAEAADTLAAAVAK